MKKFMAGAFILAALSLGITASADVIVGGVTETESGITVTLTSESDATAQIIAASYGDDDTLTGVAVTSGVALTAGETVSVDIAGAADMQKIFVWDENQVPLCEAYVIGSDDTEEATATPAAEEEATATPSAEEATATPAAEEATATPSTGDDDTENTGDGIIHLNGTSIDATGIDGVTVDGTIVTITAAGDYEIEGTLDDGQIVVSDDLKKTVEVNITLSGVDVTSSDGAPFNGGGATIAITLTDGTENIFTDTADYTNYTTSKAPKGCVYSKRDLDIGGSGTLTVNANVKNGIVCAADLKIKKGANINVTAVNNAIKGDNGVEFTSKTGTVVVTAGGDAIKSDAIDTDLNLLESDKGYVTIAGGTFTLVADGDGIQADNYIDISGGTLNITSGTEGIKANEYNIPASDDGETELYDDDGNQVFINGYINISGGTITVNSGEDGIKATDSVNISGGTVNVTATGTDTTDGGGYDGIQVGESTDTTDDDGTTTRTIDYAGTINITGGTVNIVKVSDDGIVSNGDVIISGGTVTGSADCDFIKAYDLVDISGDAVINITSGNDGIQSGKALTETSSGDESNYTQGDVAISGGTITIVANGGNATTLSDDSDSCKGIKANTYFDITGGTITIDSADDAIHSNWNVTITGGTLNLATGDDGVHADYALTLGTDGGADDDFTIDISTSYEGLEGSVIYMLSGTSYVYSTDDGINSAGDYEEGAELATASLYADMGGNTGNMGGNTEGGSGSMGPDQGTDDTSPYGMLYIIGGRCYVEAYGDGLDSNGDIEMSGGVVLVNGPTESSNGTFDYGDGSDNYFKVTGGTLIGAGAYSQEQSVTPTVSGQGYVNSTSSSSSSSQPGGMGGNMGGSSSSVSGNAGDILEITTSSRSIYFIPKTSYGMVYATTPDMTENGNYSVSTVSSYTGNETFGKTVNGTFYGLVTSAE